MEGKASVGFLSTHISLGYIACFSLGNVGSVEGGLYRLELGGVYVFGGVSRR